MKRWLDAFGKGFALENNLSNTTKVMAEAIRKDIEPTPGYHSKITLAQDVKMGIFGSLLDSIREEAEKEVKMHEQVGTDSGKAIGYAVEVVVKFFQERYGATKMPNLRAIGERLIRD